LERRSSALVRIAAPLKSLVQRFMYLGLILSAFSLMFLGKFDAAAIDKVRIQVIEVVAPILEAFSRPAATVSNYIQNIHDLTNIKDENNRLTQENVRLLQWQTIARKLQTDNMALRQLLNVVKDNREKYISARVIAGSGGLLSNMLIVNAGETNGVMKGQTVIGTRGVIGRISQVSENSSRVLLLTDINSRVPVLVEGNKTRAIMIGKNTSLASLIHLPQGAKVSVSDRIITSGQGGAFPSGLPIGIVASTSDEGIDVQLFTDFSRLEYVRIVDFGLNNLMKNSQGGDSLKNTLNGKSVEK
jgi:rod shape-determining protein MreC